MCTLGRKTEPVHRYTVHRYTSLFASQVMEKECFPLAFQAGVGPTEGELMGGHGRKISLGLTPWA